MIKVLLADDQLITRNLLCQILEMAEDILVVAMATNGQEALEQAVLHSPDVVLMDISMPIMDGLEATPKMRDQCPKTRVLIVSGHKNAEYIRRSLRAGAFGYLLKDVIGKDLVRAIRTVHRGDRYFSEQITDLAESYK